jgi:hypothetical protein
MNLKTINIILLSFLILLLLLTLTGKLTFGHGLGDLFYVVLIAFIVLIHFTITLILRKKKIEKYWLSIIIASSTVCFLVVYETTIGRGAEHTWNGKVFLP